MKQIICLIALCSLVFWGQNTLASIARPAMKVTTNGAGQAITNYFPAPIRTMSVAPTVQLGLKKRPTPAVRWSLFKLEVKDDLWLIKEEPRMVALGAVYVFYAVIVGWWTIHIVRSLRSDLRRRHPVNGALSSFTKQGS